MSDLLSWVWHVFLHGPLYAKCFIAAGAMAVVCGLLGLYGWLSEQAIPALRRWMQAEDVYAEVRSGQRVERSRLGRWFAGEPWGGRVERQAADVDEFATSAAEVVHPVMVGGDSAPPIKVSINGVPVPMPPDDPNDPWELPSALDGLFAPDEPTPTPPASELPAPPPVVPFGGSGEQPEAWNGTQPISPELVDVVRDVVERFREGSAKVLIEHAVSGEVTEVLRLIGPAFVITYGAIKGNVGIVVEPHESMTQRMSSGLPTLDGWIYVDLSDLPAWLPVRSLTWGEDERWQIEWDGAVQSDGTIGVRCRAKF